MFYFSFNLQLNSLMITFFQPIHRIVSLERTPPFFVTIKEDDEEFVMKDDAKFLKNDDRQRLILKRLHNQDPVLFEGQEILIKPASEEIPIDSFSQFQIVSIKKIPEPTQTKTDLMIFVENWFKTLEDNLNNTTINNTTIQDIKDLTMIGKAQVPKGDITNEWYTTKDIETMVKPHSIMKDNQRKTEFLDFFRISQTATQKEKDEEIRNKKAVLMGILDSIRPRYYFVRDKDFSPLYKKEWIKPFPKSKINDK